MIRDANLIVISVTNLFIILPFRGRKQLPH